MAVPKSANQEKCTRFFQQIYDRTKVLLMKHGLDEVEADKESRLFVRSVQMAFQGAMLYIPTTDDFAITERDEEIWRRFNGHNHNELAVEFGVSVQWIYRIVNYMRARDLRERQKSMFED